MPFSSDNWQEKGVEIALSSMETRSAPRDFES